MDYTLSEVHLKLKQLSDKMGSDYFVLPVFLNFFETATYDFVGERLKIIEKTQEITDDIRTLVGSALLNVAVNPNDSTTYVSSIPTDYHALVAQDVIYDDSSRCRRSDLIRNAEYNIARNNPNKQPTKQYPLILQYSDLFELNCGTTATPQNIKLIYCKKPSFATTGEPSTRIVNLPDQSIEEILKITVTNLFSKTADERTQTQYQLQETYRKVFK